MGGELDFFGGVGLGVVFVFLEEVDVGGSDGDYSLGEVGGGWF